MTCELHLVRATAPMVSDTYQSRTNKPCGHRARSRDRWVRKNMQIWVEICAAAHAKAHGVIEDTGLPIGE
eukprot:4729966-Prymnesium_polylepis.1